MLEAYHGASVESKAIVVATVVTVTGDREVPGLAVGDSEDGAFWTAFLRSLRARGLAGVRLVISDAHEGLKAAIGAVLVGAAWPRCRGHFLRNVLTRFTFRETHRRQICSTNPQGRLKKMIPMRTGACRKDRDGGPYGG
jgi:transposase-like protein